MKALFLLFFWANIGLFFIYFSLFSQRKLYIADARPRKNALANGAMGGGSESSSNYSQSVVFPRLELSSYPSHAHKLWFIIFDCVIFLLCCFHQIVFFGIDNIHAMRDSLARLGNYLDTHGATSSDGISSFLVGLRNLM